MKLTTPFVSNLGSKNTLKPFSGHEVVLTINKTFQTEKIEIFHSMKKKSPKGIFNLFQSKFNLNSE
jgi:hypothetical protein